MSWQRSASACGKLLAAGWWPAFLLAAAGLVAQDLPEDDVELWVALVGGSLSCSDEPPPDVRLSDEELAAWMALDSDELAAALAGLLQDEGESIVTGGRLARWVINDDPQDESDDIELEDGRGDDFWVPDDDWLPDAGSDLAAVDAYEFALELVIRMWASLGVIDGSRLTMLDRWGLPEAMAKAHL